MKSKLLALTASVPLVLGLTAAYAPSSPSSPATAVPSEEPEFTQEYLALTTPVYAETVPTLSLPADATFAGVRYENGPMVGEDYYSDKANISWALDFEAMYGADARITHVIVMVPDEGQQDLPTGQSSIAPQPATNTVSDLAAGEVVVPAGTASPADEISSTSPIAAQYDAAQSSSMDAAAGADASAAAAAPVYWSPTFTEHGARPVSLPSGPRAGFYNFHSWSGNDHQPAFLDVRHGIEFETNLYDLTGPWTGSRPLCSVLPLPFIAVPDFKEQFWAVNYNWSWSALSNTGDPSLVLPYADTNDQNDDCSRQSIAIGLEYPQNLFNGSGYAEFMYVVNAPFGVESSSGVSGVLQAVENQTCALVAQQFGSYVPTNCMGLNGQVPRVNGDINGSYSTLNVDRGYAVPSLCWRNVSGGQFLQFDGTFNCSLLGGG